MKGCLLIQKRQLNLTDVFETLNLHGIVQYRGSTHGLLLKFYFFYEADLFKSYLIKEVTDLAHVCGHFSNNRIESQNDNAKDWIGRAGKTSFPMLSQKMKEFIEAQQQDIEMAVFGSGSYELSDSYRSFRQDRHVWNGLSAEQRNLVLEFENWRSKKAANSTNYSKRGKYKSINPWTDIG